MAVYLPYLMALMMFTMGLNLSQKDFKTIVKQPKGVILGCICQLLLLPIIGISIIKVFNLEPELAMGIAILCACPGGVLSNYISYIVKGDIALSISLTLISSLVCLFSIPLIINGIQSLLQIPADTIHLPILATIKKLGLITVLPILLGLFINHKFAISQKISQILSLFCTTLLVLYILYLWYMQKDVIFSSYQTIGTPVLSLIFISSMLAFIIAKTMKLSIQQQITLTVETGIQNSALAFTVAVALLHNMAYSIPIIFYTVAMFIPALIIYFISNKQLANPTNAS